MVSYGASPGRYAVLVDAGYVYESAGRLVLGRASRRDFRVAAEPLIAALLARAAARVPGELLRMYWYDAARDRVPTVEQRQIAAVPHVKVRLGNLNASGEQKGVDAQLRADLELLARHRAVSDVILVTGDEEMLPAVETAQAYGVRVHVWGVEPAYGGNQAERLIWEADTVEQLDAAFCRPFLSAEDGAEAAAVLAGAASAAALPGSVAPGAARTVPAGTVPPAAVASGAVASGAVASGAVASGVAAPGTASAGGAVSGSAVSGSAVSASAGVAEAGPVRAPGAAAPAGGSGGTVPAGPDGVAGAATPAGGPTEEQAAADAGRTLVPTPAEVFRGRRAAPPPPPVTATTVASFGPGQSGYGLALAGTGPLHGHPTHPAPHGPAGADRSAGPGAAADRPGPERPEMEQVGARIAARWLITRGRDNVADLLPGPVLPTVIDKELLVEAEEQISRSLRPYEEARRALRDGFWARLHAEFGIAAGPPPLAAAQGPASTRVTGLNGPGAGGAKDPGSARGAAPEPTASGGAQDPAPTRVAGSEAPGPNGPRVVASASGAAQDADAGTGPATGAGAGPRPGTAREKPTAARA